MLIAFTYIILISTILRVISVHFPATHVIPFTSKPCEANRYYSKDDFVVMIPVCVFQKRNMYNQLASLLKKSRVACRLDNVITTSDREIKLRVFNLRQKLFKMSSRRVMKIVDR